ncbi:hypothetical protein ADIS_3949 [Lunatimonas lonarensis]|uniref:Uncharacterized protein n=1 Tax=Lunatimonas lonarensis TaxID=1232681 RepID=R7ZN66_9BACT|nr:hypothetical protein ADIS_3949 [Lunatimonas lonarensis]
MPLDQPSCTQIEDKTTYTLVKVRLRLNLADYALGHLKTLFSDLKWTDPPVTGKVASKTTTGDSKLCI